MSCPDCFQGSVHEGQPRGKAINLHGLDTYAVEPTDGGTVKGIIVIIPDAFGWDFVNSRLLADNLADKSEYKIYLPDFMNGHSAPVQMLEKMRTAFTTTNYLSKAYNFISAIIGFIPWILRNRIGKSWPVVKGFFEQLRKEEGATLPIGAAGFCWGGKHTLLLAHGPEINGKRLIDAAFTGHPSFLSLPGDAEKIVVPVSFAIGDRDNQVSVEQAKKIKAIVEAKPEASRGELRIYDDISHGFCVRAALEVEGVAEKAAEAEDQCISWFNAHFKAGI
ncbi:Fc.00g079270.m01.CDS01 [Cosmosporella sp. VM-42]